MKRWLYVVLFASLAVNLFIAGAIATHFVFKDDHRGRHGRGPLNMRAAMMVLEPEERLKVRAVWLAHRDAFRSKIRDIRKARRELRRMLQDEKADIAKVDAALKQMFEQREAIRTELFTILRKMAAVLPADQRLKFYRAALKRRHWRRGRRGARREERGGN